MDLNPAPSDRHVLPYQGDAGGQVELPLEAMPAGAEILLPEPEQRRRFTAELVAKNRERYAAIVRALAEGISVRQICRAWGVSHHTVAAIREREPALVASEKQAVAGRLRRIVRLASERLEEALEDDTLPAQSLPVVLGITIDKLAVLEGQPTQVLEIRREGDAEAVKRAFAALAAAAAAARPPVIDVDPGSAPDSESGAIRRIPAESCEPRPDRGSGVETSWLETPAGGPAGPAAAGPSGAGSETGGGGIRLCRGGAAWMH